MVHQLTYPKSIMNRRILIVDDHPLVRDALRSVLEGSFSDIAFEEADDFNSTLNMVSKMDFDLILLDLKLPGAEGLSALLTLRSHTPATPIVVISHIEDRETVQSTLRCGASGFIPKSTSRELIAQGIQLVLSGGVFVPQQLLEYEETEQTPSDVNSLTKRQSAVLELVLQGFSNKQIAYQLQISEWTVKSHMAAIFRALKVRNRVEAVLIAKQLGIVNSGS